LTKGGAAADRQSSNHPRPIPAKRAAACGPGATFGPDEVTSPSMTAPSLVQQVIDRCQDALFTGTIRVHTRQADGELWLLSGILERVRFGVSLDDEAMGRLLAADAPRVELVACLPNPHGGFKKGHPIEGELGAVLPVDLLRFCERHALTCVLELRSGASHGEVVYRLGELVSVRCDAGTERGVALMLEWSHGHYRFVLPTVTLPQRTPASSAPPPPPPPSEDELAPDSSAWRTASNEALKRKAEEAFAKSQAEEKRLADEVEEKRLAEEAEAKRRADEAEAKRRADEAEAKRRADEAEAKRRADEAERHTEAAEARRLAEEIEARHAEVARAQVPTCPSEAPQPGGEEKLDAKAKRKLAKQRAAIAKANRRAALAEQRRLEDEARAAASKLSAALKTETKLASVVVQVRRVVTEYAFVSVPIAPAMLKQGLGADGAPAIDMEALHVEAARLARGQGLAWKAAGEPVVEAQPISDQTGETGVTRG
jgi:hypothetical protein